MTTDQRGYTKEVVIFDDPRICVTSEHEDVGAVRAELLAVLGVEEFNRLCTHEHRIIFDAEYICRTSGGAIYHVIRTTIGDATHNDEKRHTYYAVEGGGSQAQRSSSSLSSTTRPSPKSWAKSGASCWRCPERAKSRLNRSGVRSTPTAPRKNGVEKILTTPSWKRSCSTSPASPAMTRATATGGPSPNPATPQTNEYPPPSGGGDIARHASRPSRHA